MNTVLFDGRLIILWSKTGPGAKVFGEVNYGQIHTNLSNDISGGFLKRKECELK